MKKIIQLDNYEKINYIFGFLKDISEEKAICFLKAILTFKMNMVCECEIDENNNLRKKEVKSLDNCSSNLENNEEIRFIKNKWEIVINFLT